MRTLERLRARMGEMMLHRGTFCFVLTVCLFVLRSSVLSGEAAKGTGGFFSPLEQLVPGLTLKAFVENETDFSLSSRDGSRIETCLSPPCLPPTVRRRAYTFQKIEWLTEIEARYRTSDRWNLVATLDYLYDSAWDWDSSFREEFNDSRSKLQKYKGDRILRDTYLDLHYSKTDIRLGKQQVVWGKVDGRKIMDIINPEDLREQFDAAQDDWIYTRFPLWMANVQYYPTTETNLQFLWIPDFQATLPPPQNSVWEFNRPARSLFLPVKILPTIKPHTSWKPSDDEYALRYGFTTGGWDVHVSYFYTWSDMPTFFTKSFVPPTPNPFGPPTPGLLTLQPKHTRIHQLGFNFDKTFYVGSKDFIFKGEGVHTLNKYYSIDDRSNSDGVTKRDNFIFALSVGSVIFQDWSWTFRIGNELTLPFNNNLRILPTRRHIERVLTDYGLSIVKFFFHDRAQSNTLIIRTDQEEWRVRQQFFWDITDHVTVQLGAHFFRGPKRSLVGQFQGNDEIELGIKYNF
jgi:hypothetical protein